MGRLLLGSITKRCRATRSGGKLRLHLHQGSRLHAVGAGERPVLNADHQQRHTTADAHSVIAIAAVRRLPLWTQAIAISVRMPSATTPAHFAELTADSLM